MGQAEATTEATKISVEWGSVEEESGEVVAGGGYGEAVGGACVPCLSRSMRQVAVSWHQEVEEPVAEEL